MFKKESVQIDYSLFRPKGGYMELSKMIEIVISFAALVVALFSLCRSSEANRIAKEANVISEESNKTAEASNKLAKEANDISKESNAIAKDGLQTALNKEKPFFKASLINIKFPNEGSGLKDLEEVLRLAVPACMFSIKNITENDAYYFGFYDPIMEYNREEIKALETKKIDMTFQLKGSEVSKILEYTNERMDKYFYRFELKVYWENKYRSKYSGIIKFRCQIARCGSEDKWEISPLDKGRCELV